MVVTNVALQIRLRLSFPHFNLSCPDQRGGRICSFASLCTVQLHHTFAFLPQQTLCSLPAEQFQRDPQHWISSEKSRKKILLLKLKGFYSMQQGQLNSNAILLHTTVVLWKNHHQFFGASQKIPVRLLLPPVHHFSSRHLFFPLTYSCG